MYDPEDGMDLCVSQYLGKKGKIIGRFSKWTEALEAAVAAGATIDRPHDPLYYIFEGNVKIGCVWIELAAKEGKPAAWNYLPEES
jgi:hypothetical protein